MDNKKTQIGKRIKARREELGLTQEELGNTLWLNKSTIQRYEAGKVENIKIPVLHAMAKALDVNPEWLALKTNTMKPFAENFNFANEDEINADNFNISDHEKNVITAYRSKPEMQPAVDKLLGVNADEDTVVLPSVARSSDNRPAGTIHISKEKLEQLRNAPSVDKEEDI